jgi:anti-anti-sigma factor
LGGFQAGQAEFSQFRIAGAQRRVSPPAARQGFAVDQPAASSVSRTDPAFRPGDRVRLRVAGTAPELAPGTAGEVLHTSAIQDVPVVAVAFESDDGAAAETLVFEGQLEPVESLLVLDLAPAPPNHVEPFPLTRRDGVTIFTPQGELDAMLAPELRAGVLAEIGVGRPCVVDLRRVTFVDSSIMSALLTASRHARETGASFAIVLDDDSWAVRRLLEVAGIVLLVRQYRDLDAAVAAARPAASAWSA